ncbi:HU family DNA-binding protein [Mycoplasmatota bacterium WC44]
MAKKKSKSTKSTPPKLKTMTQQDIYKAISNKLRGFTLSEIKEILDAEKQVIKKAVKQKKRVIMKDYMTLYGKTVESRKWTSKLDGVERVTDPRIRVCTRIGKGFKTFVN